MPDTGTVNIHGKAYSTVAKRVQDFRESKDTKDFTIETELLSRDDQTVVMRAIIRDTAGRIIATGHAEENRTSSQINRTSALEVCETSAIGRALAAFGLAGTEFASADEVANAISQQAPKPPVGNVKSDMEMDLATPVQKRQIQSFLQGLGIAKEKMADYLKDNFNVEPYAPMPKEDAKRIIEALVA